MRILINEKLSPHRFKTSEGYLICIDAILARTGKQEYRKGEIWSDCEDRDAIIEIDRKPEQVFDKKTLASFENKPITIEHPDENVNSSNYKEYSVGFVRDVHKGVVEGQDVILGTLVITDEKAVSEIENGEHTELSCGYDCDITDSENPEQINIRGNHVALCECGRAGIARIIDSMKSNKKEYEINDNQYITRQATHKCQMNDESITIEGDWTGEGIRAATKMGLTFKFTGRRVNGYPEAKISGDRQTLIKYFKKWYDPDFFEDGYDVFDSMKDSLESDIEKELNFNGVKCKVYRLNSGKYLIECKTEHDADIAEIEIRKVDGNYKRINKNMIHLFDDDIKTYKFEYETYGQDFKTQDYWTEKHVSTFKGKNPYDAAKSLPDDIQIVRVYENGRLLKSYTSRKPGEWHGRGNKEQLKGLDSIKVKDIDRQLEVYNLCKANHWYTAGNTEDYEYMLYHADVWPVEKIAMNIANHNSNENYASILAKLKTKLKDSIKDDWNGIRKNGVIYSYHDGYFYITHKNGKIEKLPESKFKDIDELYNYVDAIKDSSVDSIVRLVKVAKQFMK